MNPLPWMLAMYVVLFTRTLAHELGHAVAALRVTADPVLVLTGRPLTVARLGRLSLGVGLGTTGGVCYHGPSASARAQAAIAAAGPATSLVVGLGAAVGVVLADPSLRSFGGAFLVLMALVGITDAIVNAWPSVTFRGELVRRAPHRNAGRCRVRRAAMAGPPRRRARHRSRAAPRSGGRAVDLQATAGHVVRAGRTDPRAR